MMHNQVFCQPQVGIQESPDASSSKNNLADESRTVPAFIETGRRIEKTPLMARSRRLVGEHHPPNVALIALERILRASERARICKTFRSSD